MLIEEDKPEAEVNQKINSLNMMQTAQFFSQNHQVQDDKINQKQEKQDEGTSQKTFQLENTTDSLRKKNLKGQVMYKKQHTPQREMYQSTKCLTSHDQPFYQQEENEQILIDQTDLMREYSAPSLSPVSQKNKLHHQHKFQLQSGKGYNVSSQRINIVNLKGEGTAQEIKKRGLSLAYDFKQNEDKDTIFWNKINQIVCIKDNPNLLQTQSSCNNSTFQYPSLASSLKQPSILSMTNHKADKGSTNIIKNYSKSSEGYIQDIQKQQFQSPYHPLKNVSMLDYLPLLNGASQKIEQQQQQQQKKQFFGNISQDCSRKQAQLNFVERNFWSSQLGMRQDMQNMQQSIQFINSTLSHTNHRKSENNQRDNIQLVLSASPSQKIQQQQPILSIKTSSCKNFAVAKSIIRSPSESILGNSAYLNEKYRSDQLLQRSNNFINEVPSIQANIEQHLSFQSKQQVEGIENYYQDTTQPLSKVAKNAFSSHSPFSSQDNDQAYSQQVSQKFNEFLIKDTEKKNKQKLLGSDNNIMIDLIGENLEKGQIQGYTNDGLYRKNKQIQGKIKFKENNTQKGTNHLEQQKNQEEISKDNQKINGFKENYPNQQDFKYIGKINGIKNLHNNVQLNTNLNSEIKNEYLEQTVQPGLRERSINRENQINVNINQKVSNQKSSISTFKQAPLLNQEFSFCYDNNQKNQNNQDQIDFENKNILEQIYNPNPKTYNSKDYYNTNDKLSSLKRWGDFESLSQTAQNNTKFNLKCKQQQNVVKKIFNFDGYQAPQANIDSELVRSRIQSNTYHASNLQKGNINAQNYQYIQLQKQLIYYTGHKRP